MTAANDNASAAERRAQAQARLVRGLQLLFAVGLLGLWVQH